MPISVHNIYSFYEYEPSDAEFKMEQYLAHNHGDIRRGVRKPDIEGNVDFEIKGQFLRDLRDNSFSGLEISTRQMLDTCGLISRLTATWALVTIQEMADHSHKWHDEEGNEGTREYNSNRMSTITYKLKSLNRDMRNLKENVYAIKG
nr:hypothetical protein [Tanacetum cinerariifolium]